MRPIIDRIFADHYQFYLYDSAYDHYDDARLEWKEENRFDHGYLATERAIYVSTVDHLNDHRIRVLVGEEADQSNYERYFAKELIVDSGQIVVSAPANAREDDLVVELEPGVHRIEICGNSIGKDLYSFDPDADQMEDEEYLEHDEFEHYDIYITLSEQDGDCMPRP